MVKVVFLENVGEHKLGEVKNVSEGYARNFLLRKGVAKIATEAEVSAIESQINKLKKEEEEKVKETEKVASKLSKTVLKITAEVNEEGHLYGAVTNKEVHEALLAHGFDIEAGSVILEEHIKSLGEHEATINLAHGVSTKVKLEVGRK